MSDSMSDGTNSTLFPRASGILLHPSSLPGKYGIGDLGDYAYQFVDYLAAASQSLWQVLPLGPTSYGDSPYQCLSAFAGNTNLISLDHVQKLGWLSEADLADVPKFPTHTVDYGPVIEYHTHKLALAYQKFDSAANDGYKQAFTQWCEKQAYWLEDYALFLALKNENGGKPWVEWANADEALYVSEALATARTRLSTQIGQIRFCQWLFFAQWDELKSYAHQKGVKIVGDIPIFVAHDSADVWANRKYFYLDTVGKPTVIAGVPPDYFSPTGQRWGNPLYRWDVLKSDGYGWWINRIKASLEIYDYIRVDHFRAFEDYWEIPGTEATAVKGKWVKGPNIDFFNVLKANLGELPIIAEDLGDITQAVEDLRDALGLPGMKILQFGWSDPDNAFLPHNYDTPNCVVYTGTHDNNTVAGWWQGEGTDAQKQLFAAYVGHEITEPHKDMLRLAMMSVAQTCVTPLQDVLGYGAETRMNTPGREQGNWGWRFKPEVLNEVGPREHLKYLTHVYGRNPRVVVRSRG
ncbi:MAG TPA: 4-alpha-glucanotransferase [Phototrophicaceae bacterium]|nr:4-alpha-glucanotransferase [Phototrophicaceae bacterium]